MKKTWTQHTKDEKFIDEIKRAFLSSTVVRDRLKEICEDEIKSSFSLSKSQYDSPNWQMLQADAIGYKRAMEKIISLLS